MIYFQIFTTFRYKSLKNSNEYTRLTDMWTGMPTTLAIWPPDLTHSTAEWKQACFSGSANGWRPMLSLPSETGVG